jgi:peptidoglycan/LPS O-acetylase OafA/YrhL
MKIRARRDPIVSSQPRSAERYLSLDVLRGLAALSVVVYHWEHFLFFPGQDATPHAHASQPFYEVLRPLYDSGYMAVDLFFSLSGFIFFCFYANRIRYEGLSGGHFAYLRLSRLYPLHFLTLLLVAVLQYFYFNRYDAYFVYQDNDLRRFILQLLFASNWLPNEPYSFNGPIWSVSIEILLYALFFCVCRYASIRSAFLVFLCFVGALLSLRVAFIGRGIFSFFLGGLCFQAMNWIKTRGGRSEIAAKWGGLVIVAISLFILGSNSFSVLAAYAVEFVSTLRDKSIDANTLERFFTAWYLRIILFPA